MFNDRNQASDVVAVTERAYARIAPKWWPANAGGALVIPRRHVENLYEIEQDDGHAVWDLTQQVAKAMSSSYGCDGVSTRQHNEPAGGQDVWHLHVHVLPRVRNDALYQRHPNSRWVAADERRPFADTLRAALKLPTSFV
ncbi:HIT family protein [Serinicoccus sp. LYQ131]|uniref:HIT family protein n=1 Tax=Serinicoccus sp. LYQ131 TaxID=3378797 RepID=UPI00385416FA